MARACSCACACACACVRECVRACVPTSHLCLQYTITTFPQFWFSFSVNVRVRATYPNTLLGYIAISQNPMGEKRGGESMGVRSVMCFGLFELTGGGQKHHV